MNTPAVLARLLVAVLAAVPLPLPVSSFNLGFLCNAAASFSAHSDRESLRTRRIGHWL